MKAFHLFKEALRLLNIYKRMSDAEYRHFNRRFYAILQLSEYLYGAQIEGDYAEFGVYQGTTFSYVFQKLHPLMRTMRFFAFDSFEGLSEPKGIDIDNNFSSGFYKGQFSCSEAEFKKRIKRKGVDLQKVKTVKGWFDKTLLSGKEKEYDIKTIAAAYIDCDLYESTVPVLKFITPLLVNGSVILFDDWRCFRNHPDYGQQRACREWLEENQTIKLNHLFNYGWNGIAYTVYFTK